MLAGCSIICLLGRINWVGVTDITVLLQTHKNADFGFIRLVIRVLFVFYKDCSAFVDNFKCSR